MAMIVLGVDTAGGACSVAVRCGGRTRAARQRLLDRGHAEALVPMILETLGDAGLGPADIELYGVTVGPGAFTGLRVGLAAVSGMALARGRPIVGVGSFDAAAVAAQQRFARASHILVALESRRVELFACLFVGGAIEPANPTPIGEPLVTAPQNLVASLPAEALAGPLVVTGDAAVRARDAIVATGATVADVVEGPVDPGVVAAIAETRSGLGSRNAPAPIYLRAPDARLAESRRA